MGRQAFIKDLTLPLVQRNLVGAGDDKIVRTMDIAGHGRTMIF